MTLLLISFIAGILTILAPCVLPVLPVVIGTSWQSKKWQRPAIVIASLSLSIIIFTLLLKASTLLINVHPNFWTIVSGVIIFAFGIFTIWPGVWDKVAYKLKFGSKSEKLLHQSASKKGNWSAVLTGFALGPVFSSCSPTYAIILATVLPQNFTQGLIYLIAYALGLAVVLLVISLLGQKIVGKLGWLADPKGWFKKTLGIIMIIVGLLIMSGYEKKLETYLLDQGFFKTISIENQLIEEMYE